MSLLVFTCAKPVLSALGAAGIAFLGEASGPPVPPPLPPQPGLLAPPAAGDAPALREPVIPEGERFPFAIPIPDKKGFYFNPWTMNPVDCRGIPPGTVVRDPADPDPDHMFRTPRP